MASNAGKRLDKLEKLLDQIATRNKQHHFVVVDADNDADAQIALLAESGIIKDGDDVQVVAIPWKVRELRGTEYIPEGSDDDPYADPQLKKRAELGPDASSPTFDPLPLDRERRWKEHERRIELDGTRYQGKTG